MPCHVLSFFFTFFFTSYILSCCFGAFWIWINLKICDVTFNFLFLYNLLSLLNKLTNKIYMYWCTVNQISIRPVFIIPGHAIDYLLHVLCTWHFFFIPVYIELIYKIIIIFRRPILDLAWMFTHKLEHTVTVPIFTVLNVHFFEFNM